MKKLEKPTEIPKLEMKENFPLKKSVHATILIKSPHPTGLEDFFSRLFWKEPRTVKPALSVYNMIKDDSFNRKKRDNVMKEAGLTYGQYYHLLKCLKSLGLIRKSANKCVLSNEFAERPQKLIEYAKEQR